MKTTRSLAASFVVTAVVGCGHAPAPAAPTVSEHDPNEPAPTVSVAGPADDTSTTGPPTDPEQNPPAGTDSDLQPIPRSPGLITVADEGSCSWRSIDPEETRPSSRAVRCPPWLAEADSDSSDRAVRTEADGTCARYEREPPRPCPEGMFCNPPPPTRIEIPCASDDGEKPGD